MWEVALLQKQDNQIYRTIHLNLNIGRAVYNRNSLSLTLSMRREVLRKFESENRVRKIRIRWILKSISIITNILQIENTITTCSQHL